ncbi:MAG: hypothetical protein BWZ10_01060 [candidate division BRC1 bacterium ADurb.BinA364]|nr:MAG: hypothetical protein BWZ10_01060 [candidate division BRC1 bacterium ADurb.BinA364]
MRRNGSLAVCLAGSRWENAIARLPADATRNCNGAGYRPPAKLSGKTRVLFPRDRSRFTLDRRRRKSRHFFEIRPFAKRRSACSDIKKREGMAQKKYDSPLCRDSLEHDSRTKQSAEWSAIENDCRHPRAPHRRRPMRQRAACEMSLPARPNRHKRTQNAAKRNRSGNSTRFRVFSPAPSDRQPPGRRSSHHHQANPR